jgi:hypothetical protein
MSTVKAEFDGRVFVPLDPIQLPAGTKVEVIVLGLPRAPTAEEKQVWQQIQQELTSSEPYFATVEDALRYSRKRP